METQTEESRHMKRRDKKNLADVSSIDDDDVISTRHSNNKESIKR